MYEDVPTSNIPNKVRVIELVNQNVISFSHHENSKNAGEVKHSGVFFNFNEVIFSVLFDTGISFNEEI